MKSNDATREVLHDWTGLFVSVADCCYWSHWKGNIGLEIIYESLYSVLEKKKESRTGGKISDSVRRNDIFLSTTLGARHSSSVTFTDVIGLMIPLQYRSPLVDVSHLYVMADSAVLLCILNHSGLNYYCVVPSRSVVYKLHHVMRTLIILTVWTFVINLHIQIMNAQKCARKNPELKKNRHF